MNRPPDNKQSRRQAPLPMSDRQRREEKLRLIERRKARKRAFSLTVLALLIMVVTVFAIILVMREKEAKPRFTFVQKGRLNKTVAATALLIRSETVVTSPDSGILKPLIAEGSRAARGQKLAFIIPPEKEAEYTELQKCERDLADLMLELTRQNQISEARAVYDESEQALALLFSLVRRDLASKELSRFLTYQLNLETILEQRSAQLSTVRFSSSRLDQLEQTRSALESSIGLSAKTIVAQTPGVVSFKLDGKEESLTPQLVNDLDGDFIRRQLSTGPAYLSEQKDAIAQQPILRVSDNWSQHIALVLPGNLVASFAPDTQHDLVIADSNLIIGDCRVVSLKKEEDSTVVVFETTNRVEWLQDRRLVDLNVVISRVEGLKVPYDALIDRDPDGTAARLMIVVNGFTRLVNVSVVDTDHATAIIKVAETEPYQPSESTILVVNPDATKEGEYIGD